MPSVIEAPETAEEAQEQLSHDAVEITLTLRPGFVSKITALLWGVAPSLREHSHSEIPGVRKGDMLLDILAREHPYIYIKAMAG